MKIGDSYYGEMKRLCNLKISPEQERACLFLEDRGQKFCVEFGYENAIEKALAIRKQEAEERKNPAWLGLRISLADGRFL